MDWTPAKYKNKDGIITKDGHAMHLDDVVKDLNRRSFLEMENFKLKQKIDSITKELEEYLELKEPKGKE